MKVSKNKTKIVSIRVNEEDYNKVCEFALISGLKTPSGLMRMYVNALVVAYDKMQKENAEKMRNGVVRNENNEANKHD